jgi:hypothetical protein
MGYVYIFHIICIFYANSLLLTYRNRGCLYSGGVVHIILPVSMACISVCILCMYFTYSAYSAYFTCCTYSSFSAYLPYFAYYAYYAYEFFLDFWQASKSQTRIWIKASLDITRQKTTTKVQISLLNSRYSLQLCCIFLHSIFTNKIYWRFQDLFVYDIACDISEYIVY